MPTDSDPLHKVRVVLELEADARAMELQAVLVSAMARSMMQLDSLAEVGYHLTVE